MSEHKPLTAKEAAAVQGYCDKGSKTYNNWCESYKAANYSVRSKYWKAIAKQTYDKPRIKEAIGAYRAKTAIKLEHNRDIAINLLNEALEMARTQGNTTAIIAATRELNAISNLHGQTITTIKEEIDVPASEQAIITESTREMNVKLANVS